MFAQEFLIRQRQQERLEEAEAYRAAHQVTELRRLERRQRRAERELLRAWQRVERLRSTLRVVS